MKDGSLLLQGIVLLAEDNPIITFDTEKILYGLGATDVILAESVDASLNAIDDNDLALAVLDIKLMNESCEEVAYKCLEASVPFFFASGYGSHRFDQSTFGNTLHVVKPYGKPQFERAIQALNIIA